MKIRYYTLAGFFLLHFFVIQNYRWPVDMTTHEKFFHKDRIAENENISTLKQDNNYYRVFCTHYFFCSAHETPKTQALQAFSMYLSPEYQNISALFKGQTKTEVLQSGLLSRPHHIELPDCSELAKPELLEMLNIKYLECNTPPHLQRWKEVSHHENQTLFKKQDWVPAPRLFDNWEEQEKSNFVPWDIMVNAWNKNRALPVWPKPENVIQTIGPHTFNVELESFTTDSLRLTVTTNKDAILFLPEFYHKHWRTYLDDQEITTLKLMDIFRGAPVPTGQHDVKFIFDPPYTQHLAIISLLSFLIILGGGVKTLYDLKQKNRRLTA